MATYTWRGRNGRGELVEGRLDAVGEGAVADQLVSMGVAPVHIAVAAASPTDQEAPWWARLQRQAVSVEDILVFSRQMYTLTKAGVPILRAFAGLQASAVKPAMVEILQDIWEHADDIEPIGTSDRARLRLGCTQAIHMAEKTTNWVYKAAGTSAIFIGTPFERRYRDLHTLSQQIQAREAHFETVGRILMNGDPDGTFLG